MGLFKSDLYRSFAVGLALGAGALFLSIGDTGRSQIVAQILPSASAAAAK